MLVKRFIGEIHFLPALFLEFKTGKIKGVQVRGGYTVDMEWKNSELVQATILQEKLFLWLSSSSDFFISK